MRHALCQVGNERLLHVTAFGKHVASRRGRKIHGCRILSSIQDRFSFSYGEATGLWRDSNQEELESQTSVNVVAGARRR
jgi:hypothetical protein